jgi:signal transduction histidine kinase
LTQKRVGSTYNEFIGKYYHFPGTDKKNYRSFFKSLPIEFVYYDPATPGGGEFFGYGKIKVEPFEDKREPGHYFVEISEYKAFSRPVFFKNAEGQILEQLFSPNTYNAQNAVRKTTAEFIEGICLDGGILLNFKADAHLVQVLGEQLIASERVGILELVKNAFDAGATYCNVKIEQIPNLPRIPESLIEFNSFEGPVIVVEDDGRGMSREEIELGWLRPASKLKTSIKERIKREREKAKRENRLASFNKLIDIIKAENKGRIPLGEKGVGRFASHRLGRKLMIKTKVAQNEFEYVLQINWDDFDFIDGTHKDLDEVKVTLTRQAPSRDYGESASGTQLIIYGGRPGFELSEPEIREINRTLLKLNSPNPDPKAKPNYFRVVFTCHQVKDLTDQITYKKYDPVFSIYGIVDEEGIFEYDYSFRPPQNIPLGGFDRKNQKLDLRTVESKLWLETQGQSRTWRRPACGSFYFHMDVWYRDRPWVAGLDKDFLEYLKQYGGISVYRDGINIFSAEWGAESDWLGLRQRQIQQAYRMSYYHIIGNVEINQSANIDLIDKTNREGMIKNQAFLDLTELVKIITYFVEVDYIGKRNEYNGLSGEKDVLKLRGFAQQSASIVTNINKNYDVVLDQYQLFESIEELGDASLRKGKLVNLAKSLAGLEENLKQVQEVQELLTEQAGFGLGIAVALHEISKTTSNFYYGVLDLIKTGNLDLAKLQDLKDTSMALESEIMRLSPLRALRNEEPIQFKVSKSINYVHSVFRRRFATLKIDFEYNADQDFEIISRYGALNQILTNLFDNSCYWMDRPDIVVRKIRLKIERDARSIIVADSGPGIHDSIMEYLFQPGASLKFPPSGLGLYISRHYMNLMKKRGDLYLVNEASRISNLSGAQFLLDFSKVNYESDDR